MDQQRASQGPDGSYDLKESHAFVYEALSKELFVGNVYLRVYNDQPDSEISEPETFCFALVDFISSLVCDTKSSDPDVQMIGSSTEATEFHTNDSNGSTNGHHFADDSTAVSDEKVNKEEDFEVLKKLQCGLTSLQVHNTLIYIKLGSELLSLFGCVCVCTCVNIGLILLLRNCILCKCRIY